MPLVDLLRSTLGQRDLAITWELVVAQRLLSSREVHRSNARKQGDNGDPTRYHYDVNEVRVPLLVSSLTLQFLSIPL